MCTNPKHGSACTACRVQASRWREALGLPNMQGAGRIFPIFPSITHKDAFLHIQKLDAKEKEISLVEQWIDGCRYYSDYCKGRVWQSVQGVRGTFRFEMYRCNNMECVILSYDAQVSAGITQDEMQTHIDTIVTRWQAEFPTLPIWPESL